MHNLDLTFNEISKIEGKASCEIKVRDGKLTQLKFSIAEYKRFYTQAIRGKDIAAIPQLTARICGTCSNAHLICAVKAVENALKMTPSRQTIILRKLLNYGLNIRDHALHLYVFVLPDLFNKDSLLDFNEEDSLEHKLLHDAFEVKKAGNNLGKAVGGRSVHAPFIMAGGFSVLPKNEVLDACRRELAGIRHKIIDLVDIFDQKDITLKRKDLHYTALTDEEYSFLEGKIRGSDGSVIEEREYGNFLNPSSVPYSHASAFKFKRKLYTVGALARLNLNKDKLHLKTRQSLAKYLDKFPSDNIFHNNLAQAIEILHAVDSSIDLISSLKITAERPSIPPRREAVGTAVIEAPRGTLFYQLETDKQGKVRNGRIVVPTGQNQLGIEASIRQYLETNLEKIDKKEELELGVERIVRSYDPCMSCASHFLKFKYL